MIAQTREKQAVTLSEIEWRNRKIPVRHEKIRLFLLNVQDSQQELEQAPDLQAKIAVYERLLLDCKDALQVVRDEIKDQVSTVKTIFAIIFVLFSLVYVIALLTWKISVLKCVENISCI